MTEEKTMQPNSDAKARLAAANARIAELEAKRAIDDAERDELRMAEQAERALKLAEKLPELEAQHGRVGEKMAVVETSLGSIVVKRPNALLFRRFLDNEKTNTTEIEKLVRSCLVYPSAGEVDRIFDEQPASLMLCCDAVVDLAGFRSRSIAKK